MNLQKIYTALLTADLAAAETWYTKLLGRALDNRLMDSLVQWELYDHVGVCRALALPAQCLRPYRISITG